MTEVADNEREWSGLRQPLVSVFGVLTVIAVGDPIARFRRIRVREAVRGEFTGNPVAAEAIKLALPRVPQPDAVPLDPSAGPLAPQAQRLGAASRASI